MMGFAATAIQKAMAARTIPVPVYKVIPACHCQAVRATMTATEMPAARETAQAQLIALRFG
jgi:hypothetical protein